jgi:hypothetical protein
VGNLFRGDALTGTWTSIVLDGAGGTAPHADTRALAVTSAGFLIDACDGGLYGMSSPATSARRWESLNGNLQITEVESVAWDAATSTAFIGNQDTGVAEQPSAGAMIWNQAGPLQGDGNTEAWDPVNDVRYMMSDNLHSFVKRNSLGVVTPVALAAPSTPLVLWSGVEAGDHDLDEW